MTTTAQTMAFIEDQLEGLDIRTARMFGEYAVYCDGKVVAFVCDDVLLIKQSAVDPALLEGTYPGWVHPRSKQYAAVPGDLLENRDWLHAAIQGTADALPLPAPKRKR